MIDFFDETGDPGIDYDAKVLGQADRAIVLAPDDPYVYYPKAIDLAMSGRHSEAPAAVAINPNYVLPYRAHAVAENSLGRYEQPKTDVERAMLEAARRGTPPRTF